MHLRMERYQAQVEEIAAASNRLAALGYVSSQGGNLSMRVEEDVVLITPTQVAKREIAAADICAIDMKGATLYAGEGRRPTSETPFHLRVFQRRPDLRSIVHAHPPVLTGFAIAGGDVLLKPYLPEPVIEVGPMVMVPYAQPGSDALADAFDAVLGRSNGFLMENHGALMTSEQGILRAVDLLEMMECAAQSVLVAMQLGNLKPLPMADVRALGDVLTARNLAVPGGPGAKLTEQFS